MVKTKFFLKKKIHQTKKEICRRKLCGQLKTCFLVVQELCANLKRFVHDSSSFLDCSCGLVGNFAKSYPSVVCKNFENQNFVHDASNPLLFGMHRDVEKVCGHAESHAEQKTRPQNTCVLMNTLFIMTKVSSETIN